MRRRRYLLTVLAAAVAVLGAILITGALRDTEPPQLYLEVEGRLPVGEAFPLFISADEPVTYVIEYGGARLEEVAQEFTFELTAVAGMERIDILATDGAGNATEASALVTGVPPLAPGLDSTRTVRSGDPLAVWVRPQGEVGDPLLTAQVVDVLLTLDGAVLPTLPAEEGAAGRGDLLAMAATPLTVEPTTLPLELTVVDEFGRKATVTDEVVLEPLPVEVEQLQLSAATLALITPEGRELEAAAVDGAWARAHPSPLWDGPFLMPIGGVNTSGFGDARRYAPGGPVSFHYGLDLAAPMGTPVHATNRGRVLVAGHYPIKGGFVMLDHGAGVMSYYMHLSKLLVTEGDEVAAGELIGEVGSEGLSTGPHLHWEMRVHQEASSPLEWVDRVFPGDPLPGEDAATPGDAAAD